MCLDEWSDTKISKEWNLVFYVLGTVVCEFSYRFSLDENKEASATTVNIRLTSKKKLRPKSILIFFAIVVFLLARCLSNFSFGFLFGFDLKR